MKREKEIRMGLVRFSSVWRRAKREKRGGKIKRRRKGEKIRKREWENKEDNRTREFLKWENKRENEQVLGRGFC